MARGGMLAAYDRTAFGIDGRYGRSPGRRPLAELAYSLKQFVQPASRGSVSGVGSGGADVALGGGHRFVAQQVHQDVHADICVGP